MHSERGKVYGCPIESSQQGKQPEKEQVIDEIAIEHKMKQAFMSGKAQGKKSKRMKIQAAMLMFYVLLSILSAFADDFEDGKKAYVGGDYKTAYQLFLKAADQGNTRAKTYLRMMCANGQGVGKSCKESARSDRLATEKGQADAQSNCGVLYDKAQGILQDEKEAVKSYRLAAEQGDAGAQVALGVRYETGDGVQQDYKEALKWYHLAADQGYALAQTYLGVLYKTGESVPQDYREAAKWFCLAAEQGDTLAKCNLSALYASGRGVSRNMSIAKQLAKEGINAGENLCQEVWKKYNLANY